MCTFTGACSILVQYETQQDIEEIQYITFLLMARAGLRALEFYNPATKKHGQAHMQARYVVVLCFRGIASDSQPAVRVGSVSLST